MKSIKNKVVAITGAGSGIGRALAEAFAKEGAALALNDYSKERLLETKKMVEALGSQAMIDDFDVVNREAMEAFAVKVEQSLGAANIIINNAGVSGVDLPTYTLPIEDYERIMQVNFWSVVYGTKAFLPQIVSNGEGAVINMSSIFGLVGMANNSEYCASKAAVKGFTESLAMEFTENKKVNILCVHPGGIKTNIGGDAASKEFEDKYLRTMPEELAQRIIKGLKRGENRIVYGYSSATSNIGQKILPFKWFKALAWKDLKKIINLSDYPKFI